MKKLYDLNGESKTLQEWGDNLGIKWKTLWARINKGYSIEDALNKDFKPKKAKRDQSKTLTILCEGCEKYFTIPKCRKHREKSCSSECKAKVRKEKKLQLKNARTRLCKRCSAEFIVKKSQIDSGNGNYCSHKCAYEEVTKHILTDAEVVARSKASFRESLETGRYVPLKGEDNPQWKGGREQAVRRQVESGKKAQYIKQYRKNNPHKTREWSRKRKNKFIERLPRGTLSKIGKNQKWKCAVCKCDVKNKYHVDHINPLSKGGLHKPDNLQLLCPSCNLRKSAKDPIDFMQERGFLL